MNSDCKHVDRESRDVIYHYFCIAPINSNHRLMGQSPYIETPDYFLGRIW